MIVGFACSISFRAKVSAVSPRANVRAPGRLREHMRRHTLPGSVVHIAKLARTPTVLSVPDGMVWYIYFSETVQSNT